MEIGFLNQLLQSYGPLVVAIGGLAWFINKSKPDQNFQKLVLARLAKLEEDEARCRENLEELRDRIRQLESEKSSLAERLNIMEGAHLDLPWPMWLKDRQGVIISLNEAYEERYLIPRGYTREDYVGHTDYAVWPKEIADAFRNHDETVARSGRMFDFRENIIDKDGNVKEQRFMKFPRRLGGAIIGIAGIQVPEEGEQ